MGRPTIIEARRYLRLRAAAAALGMHEDTLRKYMNNGTLPAAPRNASGLWLFTPEWIEWARRVLDGGKPVVEVVNG